MWLFEFKFDLIHPSSNRGGRNGYPGEDVQDDCTARESQRSLPVRFLAVCAEQRFNVFAKNACAVTNRKSSGVTSGKTIWCN